MCRSVALDVVRDMTKQRFKAYVQQAQKERDRRSAAQVLKKLVQFNALVVTPVLERVKTGGRGYCSWRASVVREVLAAQHMHMNAADTF